MGCNGSKATATSTSSKTLLEGKPRQPTKLIKSIFHAMDPNADGTVSRSELIAFCKEAGMSNAAAALERSCNLDMDRKVTVEEWKVMFRKEAGKGEKDMIELLAWWEKSVALSAQMSSDGEDEAHKSELIVVCRGTVVWNGKVSIDEWKAAFSKDARGSQKDMLGLLALFQDHVEAWMHQRLPRDVQQMDVGRNWRRIPFSIGAKIGFMTVSDETLGSNDVAVDGKITIEDWKFTFAEDIGELGMWFQEAAEAIESRQHADMKTIDVV